jgi:regulator of sigma E protease
LRSIYTVVRQTQTFIVHALRGEIPDNSFVGVIGMGQATNELAQRGGALALFQWFGLLSLNLAIVNLLPLPAIDGGRLLFVLLEIVRGGKRIDPQKEALVHLAGMVFLLGLMLVISFFDIQRLLSGKSILP